MKNIFFKVLSAVFLIYYFFLFFGLLTLPRACMLQTYIHWATLSYLQNDTEKKETAQEKEENLF